MWALSPFHGFVSARHLGLFGSSLPFLRKGLPESLRIQICSLQSSYVEPTVPPLARRLSVSTSGEEPAALTLFGAMISRAPRSQFLHKSNTPPAPLRQCSKWLPSCLTCGILLYRRLLLFVLVPLAQAVPTSSTPELNGSPFFSELDCRLQRDCRLSPVLSG